MSCHLDQTSVVNKGFTTWSKRELFVVAGPTQEIPCGQDRPILPARVANQDAGCAASCTPFPSCPKPLFQSEAQCDGIDMKMIVLF